MAKKVLQNYTPRDKPKNGQDNIKIRNKHEKSKEKQKG